MQLVCYIDSIKVFVLSFTSKEFVVENGLCLDGCQNSNYIRVYAFSNPITIHFKWEYTLTLELLLLTATFCIHVSNSGFQLQLEWHKTRRNSHKTGELCFVFAPTLWLSLKCFCHWIWYLLLRIYYIFGNVYGVAPMLLLLLLFETCSTFHLHSYVSWRSIKCQNSMRVAVS